jgi:cytochrome c-type biogenesis protein CcmH/NrfF
MRRARHPLSRWMQVVVVVFAVMVFVGAGDESARFNKLGHRMMCACGCGQILLECNHVGCQYSDKMRNELLAALTRGGGSGSSGSGTAAESDDLILQGFVQNYGPTVIAAPTVTGFNRVAWVMPFLALGMGMAFVVLVVRSWRHKPTPALADGIIVSRGGELDDYKRKARQETDL